VLATGQAPSGQPNKKKKKSKGEGARCTGCLRC
jgi:hypothetical protein